MKVVISVELDHPDSCRTHVISRSETVGGDGNPAFRAVVAQRTIQEIGTSLVEEIAATYGRSGL